MVQEAYIQAYTKLDQLRGHSFGAWAARTVINEALGRLRRGSLKLAPDVLAPVADSAGGKKWEPDSLALAIALWHATCSFREFNS